jgi:hypothetical protein
MNTVSLGPRGQEAHVFPDSYNPQIQPSPVQSVRRTSPAFSCGGLRPDSSVITGRERGTGRIDMSRQCIVEAVFGALHSFTRWPRLASSCSGCESGVEPQSESDLVALSELAAKEAATSDKALKIGLVGCLRFRYASSGPHQCVECSSLTRTLRIVPSRHRQSHGPDKHRIRRGMSPAPSVRFTQLMSGTGANDGHLPDHCQEPP